MDEGLFEFEDEFSHGHYLGTACQIVFINM